MFFETRLLQEGTERGAVPYLLDEQAYKAAEDYVSHPGRSVVITRREWGLIGQLAVAVYEYGKEPMRLLKE